MPGIQIFLFFLFSFYADVDGAGSRACPTSASYIATSREYIRLVAAMTQWKGFSASFDAEKADTRDR